MNETLQQVLAELPEIKQRADKATAGPWFYEDNKLSWDLYTHGNDMFNPKLIKAPKKSSVYAEYWPDKADADFITHAREDVPKLCDALQAAADEIERLNGRLVFEVQQYKRSLLAHNSIKEQNQRLQVEINQLREALQVYADDSNWSSDWGWKGINDPTLIAKRELGGNQG